MENSNKKHWYKNIWLLFISAALCPPFALYMIYKWAKNHPQEFSKSLNDSNDTYTYI